MAIGSLSLFLTVLAAVWLLPWLLMPDDLRRMQGEWRLVRVETKDNEPDHVDGDHVVTITGNCLRYTHNGRCDDCWIEMEPPRRNLRLFSADDNKRSFLGIDVNVPLWLMRPSGCQILEYDVDGGRLFLGLRGSVDLATGAAVSDTWRNLHFERQ